MGKRIIQQRRGKGTPKYRSLSFRNKGEIKIPNYKGEAVITSFTRDSGHTAPLGLINYVSEGKEVSTSLIVLPEGIREGEKIFIGSGGEIKTGNILPLKEIPEGVPIYNIEKTPGDGGKFVRSAGTSARIVMKTEKGILIQLPSKKKRLFHPECRAIIGVVAGGGHLEKPLLKAGKAYHIRKAKHKLYPRVSGVSMNAVDHPFGGTRSSHKGRPTIAPHNAPPGRKMGKIRPRRTGKRKK